MFKKILVPLDGSKLAEGMLCQAEELAQSIGAELLLLRVAFVHAIPAVDVKELERKAVERAEEYLEGVAKGVRDRGVKATTHVRLGHPATEILEHSERYADLIAMTTHGRSGFGRWAMGSVADRVIRQSPKPVLMFRAREDCQV